MDPTVQAALVAAAAALVGVAGTVAVAIVSSRTTRLTNQATVEAVRQGQLTDRYAKAVEHLGDPNLDIRLGGIYALEAIARDAPERDHPTVMEVLTAFIREHSHQQWPKPEHDPGPAPRRKTRPDVQAALTVVGRRDGTNDKRPIDLSGAHLAAAKLPHGAHLAAAKLAGVDLSRVDLGAADLTEADLTGADLTGASFRPVDFTDEELDEMKLPRGERRVVTKLGHANLTGADLTGADLTGAILTNAKWPADTRIPKGWKDPGSSRLAADTDSVPAKAN